jgi:hypothetical protein
MTTTVESACYVFGIVPAGAAVPDCDGLGPASGLRLVTEGDLGALVGSLPTGRSLGRASDLLAHDGVVAQVIAARTPVLPMRFGAVLRDEEAVATELLREHRDEFVAALDRVRDRLQYTVKVRYLERVVLREILAERPDLERLRSVESFAAKLQLGELIVAALATRRPHDASTLLAEIGSFDEIRIVAPAEPDDVLTAAFLVGQQDAGRFERQVAKLARVHAQRMHVKLIGPTAAYDFVAEN